MANSDSSEPSLVGWPVVKIHYPAQVTLQTMQDLYRKLGDYLQREERFGLMHLATSGLDATTRRYMAEMRRQQSAQSRVYVAGEALVTSSPFVRGAAQAIAWLIKHPHPFSVFPDSDAAEAWIDQQLRRPAPK